MRAGRKDFILNEDEIKLLKEIDKQGQRGIVWFKNYAISIPHIEYIYMESRMTEEEFKEKTNKEFELVEKDGKLIAVKNTKLT